MQDEMKQWNEHVDAVAAKKFEDAWGVIPTTFHADNIIRRQEALLKQMAEALEAVISDLHYITVPYEQHAPHLGDELWQKLSGDKALLMEALAALKGRG